MISASSTNRARWFSLLGESGLNLLDRHVALQLAVARHPDLADSSLARAAGSAENARLGRSASAGFETMTPWRLRAAVDAGRVALPPSDAPSVVRNASSLISVSTSWVSSKAFHAFETCRRSFWCAFRWAEARHSSAWIRASSRPADRLSHSSQRLTRILGPRLQAPRQTADGERRPSRSPGRPRADR